MASQELKNASDEKLRALLEQADPTVPHASIHHASGDEAVANIKNTCIPSRFMDVARVDDPPALAMLKQTGYALLKAYLDLALAPMRRASPELASVTARYLVVDVRTSQSIYWIPDHLDNADPLIQRFERWARGRLAQGFSLDLAVKALGTSKRTLARPMQSVLGKSPLSFFQDLRIERAVHLLRTGRASVDQIAAEVGYADGVTLRALLRRRLGRGVREIRRGL
jgi:AraC-like DNA-binding protein